MEQHSTQTPPTLSVATLCASGLAALVALTAPARGGPLEEAWDGAYAGASLGVATSADGEVLRSLHGGQSWARGGMTYGVEVELAETDIGSPAGRVDRIARLKGRLGVVHRQAHVYALAGVAQMQGRFGRDNGYLLGLGAETHLSDRVTLGAELLHHRVADFDGSGEDFELNTLSGRLSYQF